MATLGDTDVREQQLDDASSMAHDHATHHAIATEFELDIATETAARSAQ